jgi:hypothetical protein
MALPNRMSLRKGLFIQRLAEHRKMLWRAPQNPEDA